MVSVTIKKQDYRGSQKVTLTPYHNLEFTNTGQRKYDYQTDQHKERQMADKVISVPLCFAGDTKTSL